MNYVNRGNRVEYIFFWGHRPRKDGRIDKSCFSQWYDSPFEVAGTHYPTAEHFMMAEKARLFADSQALGHILGARGPHEAKQLGRKVRGFNDAIWCQERYRIVVEANRAKFLQHPDLAHFLVSTGNRVLVEASPHDTIWGIGLAADDSRAGNPNLWKGLNLLGFALMEVRSELSRYETSGV